MRLAQPIETKQWSWLRGVDLNHRPLGYEPNELPDCSTPQKNHNSVVNPGQTAWRSGSFLALLLRHYGRSGKEQTRLGQTRLVSHSIRAFLGGPLEFFRSHVHLEF